MFLGKLESEASAVHYSQPRNLDIVDNHYVYTVEIPELTEDNHLVSGMPVATPIINKVEEKLGIKAPEKVTSKGKEFRKWVGSNLTGRLLMELRDNNGKLEYTLPEDAFAFLKWLK